MCVCVWGGGVSRIWLTQYIHCNISALSVVIMTSRVTTLIECNDIMKCNNNVLVQSKQK